VSLIVVVDCDSFSAEDEGLDEEYAALTRVIHENVAGALVQSGRLRVGLIALSAKELFSCNLLRMPLVDAGKEVAAALKEKKRGFVTVAGRNHGKSTLFTLKAALGAVDLQTWLVTGECDDDDDDDDDNDDDDGDEIANINQFAMNPCRMSNRFLSRAVASCSNVSRRCS
jgi:hypothetical protein